MSPRLTCCVLFCRRTRGSTKGDPLPADLTGYEWVCGPHWRAIPARRRRAWSKRRKAAMSPPAFDRIWARLKAQACAAAGGLA